MAFPSVTNTFVNATTADASQVNQNFTDLINGITDGTKDINISSMTIADTLDVDNGFTVNSAVTASGTMDVTGNTTLTGSLTVNNSTSLKIFGNGAGDDQTVTAGGAITPTNTNTIVNGAGGGADDLDTITATNFNDGDMIILTRKSTSGNITIKNGTDNISCGADKTLGADSRAVLIWDNGASTWYLVAYAAN